MQSAIPFIKTKIFIPVTRKKIVEKPLLVARLVEGFNGPLTLVTAPAGFGKTTLVVTALAEADFPVAWLSLDPSDNSAGRFLGYLIRSLQQICPKSGQEALELLEGQQPASHEMVLTSLINDLVEINQDLVMVFDDYQFINNPILHDAVSFLLNHIPRGLHLVIATRSDPPLALNRLRARGQLFEFRAEDLRFSERDAAAFLNDVMGLNLDAQSIHILEERTEGWIVGLQMAAISLRDRKDVSSFIAAFSGTNRFILDYLLDEVLNHQPPEVQRFLISTSFLSQFCAPLCDALDLDSLNSKEIIAALELSNLFLVALDDEHCWFRYHHLFRDLLRARLESVSPGLEKELHKKAARWFEDQGLLVDAINHFLTGEMHDRAARLVEENTTMLLARGELSALMSWASLLPDSVRKTRPRLCIQQAYALTFAGRLSEVEALLLQAENPGPAIEEIAQDERWLKGACLSVRAMLAAMSGHDLEAVQLAMKALDTLGDQFDWDRSAACWALGYSERSLGHLVQSKNAVEEMVRLARKMGNIWTLVTGLMDLANLVRAQGQVRQARIYYEEALHEASRYGARNLGYIARMEAGLASVLYEQNQLEQAARLVSDALSHVDQWANPNHQIYVLAVQSRILLAQNDIAGAKLSILKADEIRRDVPLAGIVRGLTDLGFIRIWLAERRNHLRSGVEDEFSETCEKLIETWLEDFEKRQGPVVEEVDWANLLMVTRVLLSLNQSNKALALLGNARKSAERMDNMSYFIEACLLEALAVGIHKSQYNEQAFISLEKALALAQTGGYVRIFLDEDLLLDQRPMRQLLSAWLAQRMDHPARDYATAIIRALDGEARAERKDDHPALSTGSGEILSQRELEILSLIAEGLTNDGIAQQLVISTGTVKAHTAAIYRKLDVANRTEAVARARQLQILR